MSGQIRGIIDSVAAKPIADRDERFDSMEPTLLGSTCRRKQQIQDLTLELPNAPPASAGVCLRTLVPTLAELVSTTADSPAARP